MTEQEQDELKRDMIEEMRQDAYEESMLRRDIDYAYDNLGLEDINIAIHALITHMYELGYDLEYKDILDKLEEL